MPDSKNGDVWRLRDFGFGKVMVWQCYGLSAGLRKTVHHDRNYHIKAKLLRNSVERAFSFPTLILVLCIRRDKGT